MRIVDIYHGPEKTMWASDRWGHKWLKQHVVVVKHEGHEYERVGGRKDATFWKGPDNQMVEDRSELDEAWAEMHIDMQARIEKLEEHLVGFKNELGAYHQAYQQAHDRLEEAEDFITQIVRENRGAEWADAYQFPNWVHRKAESYCERYGIEVGGE